ncbi:MAG: hypothetical protein IJV05_04870 [Muribaculaceae bacterium]|nr:hypothetical protein [Muribaculaceae bacterium]
MDLNSPEFYTLAFVVAMALVGLLMGRVEKKPPSTYIVPLTTAPGDGDSDDIVRMEVTDGGKVRVDRAGLSLGAEETVNLVITIQEDKCTIIEKKGLRKRHVVPQLVTGQAVLKCFKPGGKYRVRYESQLTSAWATFTLDTSSADPKQVTLRY